MYRIPSSNIKLPSPLMQNLPHELWHTASVNFGNSEALSPKGVVGGWGGRFKEPFMYLEDKGLGFRAFWRVGKVCFG